MTLWLLPLPWLPLIVIGTNLSYFFMQFTWCIYEENKNVQPLYLIFIMSKNMKFGM